MIYFLKRRQRTRILQEKGKAWAEFLELAIHTSEKSTEIPSMIRSTTTKEHKEYGLVQADLHFRY